MENIFTALVLRYHKDAQTAATLWQELIDHYSEPHRHYHNLDHLQHIYHELLPCQEDIEDWDAMLFAIFYHDIIYDPARKDNESRSADIAGERLTMINFPLMSRQLCISHIAATTGHRFTSNKDTNYFLDADLSILGAPWEKFKKYSEQIRHEYAQVPEEEFRIKRNEVLQGFLNREKIFTTPYFFSFYEDQARLNLRKAISW